VRDHRLATEICTAKIFPRFRRGKILLLSESLNYGVGDAVVVVVSVVVDVDASGVDVAAGVVVVVVVVLSEVLEVAGDGLTIVVLLSGAGEAAGATVSVFCSQAARSAALARMQMYFFISVKD
jgi:hypothetical protein